jgi:hypothetical protein
VEMDAQGNRRIAGHAPYLDYRPIAEEEKAALQGIRSHEDGKPPASRAGFDLSWLSANPESDAIDFAIAEIVPAHVAEVKKRKEEIIAKSMAAVRERLTKEITYWDHRAQQLKDQELAGKPNARLNSGKARQRAEELTTRLHRRIEELEQERHLSAQPPLVVGGALILPIGILQRTTGTSPAAFARETDAVERLAMDAVMMHERSLGFEPRDVSQRNLGYDVESKDPRTGRLRFIEVKGRVAGADVITITRNEMLCALNAPDQWRLAIVLIGDAASEPVYVAHPFTTEPRFAETSANFNIRDLVRMFQSEAERPREPQEA